VVEDYVTNKTRRKRGKIRNRRVQKYEFLFMLSCASVENFQHMKVCEKSQLSFDTKSQFNQTGNI
jgi:hypothetical protein